MKRHERHFHADGGSSAGCNGTGEGEGALLRVIASVAGARASLVQRCDGAGRCVATSADPDFRTSRMRALETAYGACFEAVVATRAAAVQHRDGVSVLGVPVLGEGGALLAVLAAADESPRKWEEAQIQALESLAAVARPAFASSGARARSEPSSSWSLTAGGLAFSNLFELFMRAPAFVAATRGPEHRFAFANDAYVNLVGRRELVGRTVRDALPELCNQGFFELLDQVYETGEPYVGHAMKAEMRPEPDGAVHERFVSFVFHPIKGPEGKVLGLISIGMDVTQQVRATTELRATQEHLRALLENSADHICVFDSAGRMTFVGPSLERVFGRPASQLIGQDVFDFVHREDLRGVRELWQDVATRPGARGTFEARFQCVDGEWRWMSGVVHNLLGHPRIQGIVCNAKDVTSQRESEKARREAESRFEALAENSLTGICVIQDGRVVYCNDRCAEIFGYSVAEVAMRSNPLDFVIPEERARVTEAIRLRTEGGKPLQYSTVALRKDGSTRQVEVYGNAMTWNGRPAALSTIIDVSAGRQTEKELKERTAALENAVEGIARIDEHGRFVRVNAAYAKLLQLTPEQLVGTTWRETVHPEDHERMLKACETMYSHGRAKVLVRAVRRDGSTFEKSVLMIGEWDEGGRYIGHHRLIWDVTGERHLEDQLRQAQKMEAVGRLAGGVAHDFNNLLTIIKSSAAFLVESLEPKTEAHEDALAIQQASVRAVGLTRQLLTFSRRQLVKPEQVDVPAYLDEMQGMLIRLVGEDVSVKISTEDGVPPVLVDAAQLQQVLLNLAANARDAMPNGGTLAVRVKSLTVPSGPDSEVPPGNYVVIEVQDNGVGMSAEVKQRLFEPFFTTKGPGSGTGLGLATAYGIIKQCNGFIHASSELGQGSTFRITLPAQQPAHFEKTASAPQAHVPGHAGIVLLVEDEDAVRRIVRRCLLQAGYHVLEARNGADALEVAQKHDGEIHLVLTDAVMPVMGGAELVRVLKARRPGINVLYMSGYTGDEILRRGIETGEVPFIFKPFTGVELAARVRQLLP